MSHQVLHTYLSGMWWYNAENNAIGGEKQNKKNKAENTPVLSGLLVIFYPFCHFDVFSKTVLTPLISDLAPAQNFFQRFKLAATNRFSKFKNSS